MCYHYWNKFLGPRQSCSAESCHISKPNLDNFHVPVNVPPDQKCSMSSQTIPKCQVHSGPSHSKQGYDYVAPINQVSSIFLFLVLYSSSYKNLLPSALFCNSPKGDCPLHEMLKFPTPKQFSVNIFNNAHYYS